MSQQKSQLLSRTTVPGRKDQLEGQTSAKRSWILCPWTGVMESIVRRLTESVASALTGKERKRSANGHPRRFRLMSRICLPGEAYFLEAKKFCGSSTFEDEYSSCLAGHQNPTEGQCYRRTNISYGVFYGAFVFQVRKRSISWRFSIVPDQWYGPGCHR